MTPQRNKLRETQQPSPQHDPNMQSSSSSSASSSLAYPPGYRFVPTDAEVIYCYLKPFSRDNNKSWPNVPIHHANIYESSPQQLSEKYKKANLTEWFFISERTKIKRDGKKQKRGDGNGGYWHSKAVTKKIKPKQQGIVGYKTTLTYYVGKPPNGVKGDWLMQEYWLKSSDPNKTVDYTIGKIYLSPTAKKGMEEEEDVEDLEEEVVQPRNIENQQPQPQPQFSPSELDSHQPQPQPQFLPTELNSHQPQGHDIAYEEPLQPQPLNTIYHQTKRHNTESEYQELHQPLPINTIHHHQPQRHDNAYQEHPQPQPFDTIIPHQPQRHDNAYQEHPQPQPLDTIIPHQPQRHDIEYQELHQSQPIHHQSHQLQLWQATIWPHQMQLHDIAYHETQPPDTAQDQPTQFWQAPLDSYPPHWHDIQYPQPQPLDAIEYQCLYQSGPLTTYENMIESSSQAKSNGDSKKVDHALEIHFTPRGIKREAEEEDDEKRKRKKKKEGGVEESNEKLEQLINFHQNSDDDDSLFTGFTDTHLLHIDIESSINNCHLKKISDKD